MDIGDSSEEAAFRAEARGWLEALPGVGPKTSAAVLLFSHLRMPALPVDSHHFRVARRLGLLPPGLAVGPAHAWLEGLLPRGWGAKKLHDNHQLLMRHGKTVCLHEQPDCAGCAVRGLCPSGQSRGASTR